MENTPTTKRRTPGPQSLKYKKSNPNVPAALGVYLYLPGIGSVVDYEWTAPRPKAEPPFRESLRGALSGGGL